MPHYQHDMMHCNQSRCSRKEYCYRFWLAMHIKESGFRYASFYMPAPTEQLGDKCQYFINIKDY